MDLSHDDVKKILELIDASEHLEEVEVVFGGFQLRIQRSGAASTMPRPRPPLPAAAAPAAPAPAAARAEPPLAADEVAVRAPMLGTYYRAASPDAPPFVEIGQRVHADDIVGLIEVMKLFNSITAGVDGVVTRIVADNAKLVEYDQVLVVISTAA